MTHANKTTQNEVRKKEAEKKRKRETNVISCNAMYVLDPLLLLYNENTINP